MKILSANELSTLPLTLFNDVYARIEKEGLIEVVNHQHYIELLTETQYICKVVNFIFYEANKYIPNSFITLKDGRTIVDKGLTWFTLERIFRKAIGAKEKAKLLELAAEDFENDPECSNCFVSRSHYDYDLIHFVTCRLAKGLPTRKGKKVLDTRFKTETIPIGAKLSFDEMQRYVPIIIPGAKPGRTFWWETIGRKKKHYTLEDLLKVLRQLAYTSNSKYKRFAKFDVIQELEIISKLEYIHTQSATDK